MVTPTTTETSAPAVTAIPTATPTATSTPTPTQTPSPTPSPTPIPAGGTLSLSAKSLNFGTIKIGKSAKLPFTITNITKTKKSTLYGDVDDSALSSPLSVTVGAGSFALTHNKIQKVTVEFAPSAIGPFSGTITIYSGDPKHQMIGVTAKGKGKK